jgi:hypothetical protein
MNAEGSSSFDLTLKSCNSGEILLKAKETLQRSAIRCRTRQNSFLEVLTDSVFLSLSRALKAASTSPTTALITSELVRTGVFSETDRFMTSEA